MSEDEVTRTIAEAILGPNAMQILKHAKLSDEAMAHQEWRDSMRREHKAALKAALEQYYADSGYPGVTVGYDSD